MGQRARKRKEGESVEERGGTEDGVMEQQGGRNHALTEDGGVQPQVASASQRLWGQREISILAPAGSWL